MASSGVCSESTIIKNSPPISEQPESNENWKKKDGSDEFGVMALREALKMARIKDHLTSSFFFLLLHLTSNTRLFSITNCLLLA